MQEIISKLNVIVPEIRTISGTVSKDGESLDDANAFTAGSVRYIDPKYLRAFTTARQASIRACRQRGVRFLSGYAVPDESVAPLLAELAEITAKVNQEKIELMDKWGERLTEWEKEHPSVAKWKSRFPSASHAERQIGASVAAYKIEPKADMPAAVEDGIASEVKGLAAQVIEEIAQDVRDTWKPGAVKASQRIKGLLRRITEKARSLSFLDGHRLGNLARLVEETIAKLPPTGAIEGNDFLVLSGLMTILESPRRMLEGNLTINMVEEQAEAVGTTAAQAAQATLPVEVQEAAKESPAEPAMATAPADKIEEIQGTEVTKEPKPAAPIVAPAAPVTTAPSYAW
ncbi:MAG: DUF3150 domain-containing protein [Anaerolineae bacterium]|nr:DUF3150 domain-containing protein [Anaerolineae bacterium]